MTRCHDCGREGAPVIARISLDNKLKKVRLCEECAAGRSGLAAPRETLNVSFSQGERLMGLLPARSKALRCPACGLGYGEFRTSGRLGCPSCYDSFGAELEELFAAAFCSHGGEGA